MKTIKTSRMSPLTTVLIGLVGTIASIVVTMQLKKMLEAKGLPERSEELKDAIRKASNRAADLKASAREWINQKTAAVADEVSDAVDTVKENTNG